MFKFGLQLRAAYINFFTTFRAAYTQGRTVSRKSSIGELYVCAGGFTYVQEGLTFKFDKNSTNL